MRNLVLTGASRGIGHATVKRFSRAGWRIITCSRQAFSDKCPWAAGGENHIQVDLADPDQIAGAIEQIKQHLGGAPLHALVNNAAISPKNAEGERLDTVCTDLQLWHTVFQVNFFAPLLLVRGFLDQLTEAQGVVINVTSIAGGRVHDFAGPAYATSKAALAALTREMASDLGPRGVRVNAIAPGEIGTEMLSAGTEQIIETLP
ncbi:MAG: SDR family oxidoreductase, partial [Pseudomonadota bacterium]